MDCLTLALLALMVQSEAATEPYLGKVAVAYVAVNRAEQSGKDVLTVLQQPHQFALNPRAKITESSWLAAQTAYHHWIPDPTHGADHFYAHSVNPKPTWYDERHMTIRIGRHTFLNLGGF